MSKILHILGTRFGPLNVGNRRRWLPDGRQIGSFIGRWPCNLVRESWEISTETKREKNPPKTAVRFWTGFVLSMSDLQVVGSVGILRQFYISSKLLFSVPSLINQLANEPVFPPNASSFCFSLRTKIMWTCEPLFQNNGWGNLNANGIFWGGFPPFFCLFFVWLLWWQVSFHFSFFILMWEAVWTNAFHMTWQVDKILTSHTKMSISKHMKLTKARKSSNFLQLIQTSFKKSLYDHLYFINSFMKIVNFFN